MNLSEKPTQKPGFHLEAIDGESLLYHLGETKILYCNQTASLIWHLCDGRMTVGEIIAVLSEAYPDAAQTMATDVEDTLQQFLNAGCIELS